MAPESPANPDAPSRAAFERRHGWWSDELAALLERDPAYFTAYDRLLAVTHARGSLTRAQQELLAIAANAQVTHLHRDATAMHIAAARAHGASDAEILETLQLASALGSHTMLVGVPILEEVLAERGEPVDVDAAYAADPRLGELKERFQRERGYWAPGWDVIMALTPEYFEAYLELSRIPCVDAELPEWFRELVYVTIDAVTTHLFTAGLRLHAAKALETGATAAQLVDALTIASCIGPQSTLIGVTAM